ncbi:MAG TPA: tetratricopeptide repeat protein [Thermoanaerobaculia bacterium]|nr:tetratricopeptide repeat protein [Thermoanaerobaculia bacterium]
MKRLLLLPALAAAGIYLGTLDHGFVYDDLWKMQALAAGGDSCWRSALAPRGLTHLTYCLDRALWGERAFGYHLTNLLLHALAAALAAAAALVLTAVRAGRGEAPGASPGAGLAARREAVHHAGSRLPSRAALLTGLLFALHPVHVEAVASFVNRKDVLAFLLAAAALLFWRSRRRPRLAYAASLLAVALAVWAKEVAAAAVPLALLITDLLPLAGNPPGRRPRLRRAALRFAPFAAALLLAAVLAAPRLAAAVAPEAVAATTELRAATWTESTALALAAVPRQVALLLLPLDLSADWSAPAARRLLHPRALLGLLLLAAWAGAAATLVRRAPVASFALAWTLLTWLPASNLLLPLTPHYLAERYLVVPSFGICLLVGWLAAKEWSAAGVGARRRPAVAALLAGVLLAAGWRTAVRVEDWSSAQRLWSASLAAGQDTWRVRTNLGLAHQQAGHRSAAVEHYRRALAHRPLPLEGRQTLVRNLALAGASGAATHECRRLLAEHPDDFDCHFIVAETVLRRGHREEALRHYRRALELRPADRQIRQRVEALQD